MLLHDTGFKTEPLKGVIKEIVDMAKRKKMCECERFQDNASWRHLRANSAPEELTEDDWMKMSVSHARQEEDGEEAVPETRLT